MIAVVRDVLVEQIECVTGTRGRSSAAGAGNSSPGGGPFGASILGLLTATFIANRLSSGLFRDRCCPSLVTAVAGTFAYNGIDLLMLQIFGVPIDWVDAITQVILPSAVLNMLASPIVC